MYTARRAASASGCSSGSTQIKVDVRSKTDPWQNLNKNKFDFGSTPVPSNPHPLTPPPHGWPVLEFGVWRRCIIAVLPRLPWY